jgi:hypothetical protein
MHNDDEWWQAMKHVDYDWVNEIAGEHGWSCRYHNPEGLLIIGYIGLFPRHVIWKYNLILFFRFLKRKFKKISRGGKRT